MMVPDAKELSVEKDNPLKNNSMLLQEDAQSERQISKEVPEDVLRVPETRSKNNVD